MNKKTIMLFSAIFIALSAFSITFFLLSEITDTESFQEEASDSSLESSQTIIEQSDKADEVISSFSEVGEELTLHSRQYNQGEQQEANSVFLGFDGDMKITVNSVKVEDFSADDNSIIDSWVDYSAEFQDPCILEFDITLSNTDAAKLSGQSYLFDSSIFKLGAYEDLIPENINNIENYYSVSSRYSSYDLYINPHSENTFSTFELNKGETQNFVIKYLIDRSYLKLKQPFLAISSSNDYRYGILLPDTLVSNNG